MKKRYFVSILFLVLIATACNTAKSKTGKATTAEKSENMKVNSIDGTWEANYVMNSPKAFDELYPKTKPTITINSGQNQISGATGCNSFRGKCSIDGNRLQIDEALALTRKMCPDMVGEQTFLATLKKVNSYSLTDEGATLNLIMGDIAVMRLIKK
ncbi:META domain-containing protein [Flavobacterium sp. RSSB_23]|uniref:META domain-containing protein n=1 Tax=Flavobacterium sp. RSSB_23 TaxID=3447668 RepID=UPI003F2C9855